MKPDMYNCHLCAENLDLSHACSLVGVSVSVVTYGPRLVDTVGFLVVSFISFAPSSLLFLFWHIPRLSSSSTAVRTA